MLWSFLLCSPITLLPTTTDHFSHTSLTLVQDQQTLIIKSELTLSFIKDLESTDILAAKHTSPDKHTSAQKLLGWSYKTLSTSQLNRWRSGKIQRLARAKILFLSICASLRSTTISSVPPLLVILSKLRTPSIVYLLSISKSPQLIIAAPFFIIIRRRLYHAWSASMLIQ